MNYRYKPTNVYMIHPSSEYLLHEKSKILVHVRSQIKEEHIVDFSSPFGFLEYPGLTEEIDMTSFFRGHTVSQVFSLVDSIRTGNDVAFLNAFSYGVIHDMDYTKSLVSSLDVDLSFFYISVPYELYSEERDKLIEELPEEDEIVKSAFMFEEEVYNLSEEHVRQLTQKMNTISYGKDGTATAVIH